MSAAKVVLIQPGSCPMEISVSIPESNSTHFPTPSPSRPSMKYAALLLTFSAVLLCSNRTVPATDFVELTPANWHDFVPKGKEVDAIYGDYALRNDKIVAIIARPSPLRNANLTIRNVGGFVLDLTSRAEQNDQLSCYVPLGGAFHFHSEKKIVVVTDGKDASTRKASGQKITVSIASSTGPKGESAIIEYTLQQGSPCLEISHRVLKNEKEVRHEKFVDSMRADRTFKFSTHVENQLFCANDDWFRQCYGILLPGGKLKKGKGNVAIEFENPKKSNRRFLFPSSSQLGAIGTASAKMDETISPVRVIVEDPRGRVGHSLIKVKQNDKVIGMARTNSQGEVVFGLKNGTYVAEVQSLGQANQVRNFGVLNQREVRVRVKYGENPPMVSAHITDEKGGGIPCKVAFIGSNGSADPDLGPDSAANPVRNLHYSHNGKFEQVIPQGSYEVIISRGPEYDAEYLNIKTLPNQVTEIKATLRRVVKTNGWVSTEYHSHSTPSGDNTSDQRGRVLNLIAENIEFAPCTEHQRIDSYMPHIRALGVSEFISTCPGMELTGNPLPLNHQNAFPLVHKPRTQDGGGPRIDPDPVVQIERLAYWDNKSDKVVQSNHPNLIQMTGDADLDNKVDGGFKKMYDFMDVVEVHPPEKIFTKPDALPAKGNRGNAIFNWMQLLNQGYRITGVVNTDAHYNFHGSGWLRNYVKSSNDNAGNISTAEMVKNSKQGHVVMTTGPFMEVALTHAKSDKRYFPGDDVQAHVGKAQLSIKIQCANWLDVNRVQVFVNGYADPKLNFTRRTHKMMFTNDVIKFDKTIPLDLKADTHIIVATIGEGLTLSRVMGSQYGKRPPVAVSNPIFVDVDGNGFKASGDKLGSPLLLKK